MKRFGRAVRFEFSKIFESKVWWIVSGVVCLLQPLIAFAEGKSAASVGLDATPLTHPGLAEALPPLAFLGFDSLSFGQVAIVVLGGMMGAREFKQRELYNTMICLNKRQELLLAKWVAVFVSSGLLSFCSVLATITMVHFGLGNLGLTPFIFNDTTWHLIMYGMWGWQLLILLSYSIGFICQSEIVPLVLLIPQIVGLGQMAAQKWSWGYFLPVVGVNRMLAAPNEALKSDPLVGAMTIIIWTLLGIILANIFLMRLDIGGSR